MYLYGSGGGGPSCVVIRLPAFSSNYSHDACGFDCVIQGAPTSYTVWSPNITWLQNYIPQFFNFITAECVPRSQGSPKLTCGKFLVSNDIDEFCVPADCGVLNSLTPTGTKANRPQSHQVQCQVVDWVHFPFQIQAASASN